MPLTSLKGGFENTLEMWKFVGNLSHSTGSILKFIVRLPLKLYTTRLLPNDKNHNNNLSLDTFYIKDERGQKSKYNISILFRFAQLNRKHFY